MAAANPALMPIEETVLGPRRLYLIEQGCWEKNHGYIVYTYTCCIYRGMAVQTKVCHTLAGA